MSDVSGPGPLVGVHRLLIGTACAGAAFFTIYSARAYAVSGDGSAATMTVASLAVTIGLGLYLRSLRGLAAKLTPRDSRPRYGSHS